MDREQYAEMVDYLTDRFGIGAMDAWTNAAGVYVDFAELDSETVWEALLAKLDGDTKAEFPPKPPALRAAALDRLRHKPRPGLPETTERYDWREHCMRTYGEVISFSEAIEHSAAEHDKRAKQEARA